MYEGVFLQNMRLAFIAWIIILVHNVNNNPSILQTWEGFWLVFWLTITYIFSFDTDRCNELDKKVENLEKKIEYLEERIKRK